MGLFVNITETFYTEINCTGGLRFVRQVLDECFKDATVCCNEYANEDIPLDTCFEGKIISCSTSSRPIQIMDYMIQIFGITFMVIILTGCTYFSVRCVICPPRKEVSEYEEIA